MSDTYKDLRVGDRVIAGAGMYAELRSSYVSAARTPTAVVRWENSAHVSRVPWHTVKPVPVRNPDT